MAKKKESTFNLKKLLNKFMNKSVQSIVSTLAEHSDQIIAWIKSLSTLGKKVKRIAIGVVIAVAGVVLLGFGVSFYLESLNPMLGNGLSQILVGAVMIIVAAFYAKSSD